MENLDFYENKLKTVLNKNSFKIITFKKYEKHFGNIILDVEFSNFIFNFISDKDTFSCFVCEKNEPDAAYSIREIAILSGGNKPQRMPLFCDYIANCLIYFNENSENIDAIFRKDDDGKTQISKSVKAQKFPNYI